MVLQICIFYRHFQVISMSSHLASANSSQKKLYIIVLFKVKRKSRKIINYLTNPASVFENIFDIYQTKRMLLKSEHKSLFIE